jgi:prolipoprotein diacylglyceryltransferase
MPEVPAQPADVPQSAAARLFDLRILIGALFIVYGIMLTVAGFFTSDKNLAKASNININLWLGIGMLIVGVLFMLWWRLNPLKRPEAQQPGSEPQPGGEAGH